MNPRRRVGPRQVVSGLFLTFATGVAGFGLLMGILTLAGQLATAGIVAMGLFLTPLWLYLLISGLKDHTSKTGRVRWLRLVTSGALLAVAIGISVTEVAYLGRCDKRLVPDGKLVSCNLSNHDMHGLDLHGANLTYANLRRANLTGTNLGPQPRPDRPTTIRKPGWPPSRPA